MLIAVFGYNREKVSEKLRKLHDEELLFCTSLQDIYRTYIEAGNEVRKRSNKSFGKRLLRKPQPGCTNDMSMIRRTGFSNVKWNGISI
jgi:phage/plasmid-associated DNA primase